MSDTPAVDATADAPSEAPAATSDAPTGDVSDVSQAELDAIKPAMTAAEMAAQDEAKAAPALEVVPAPNALPAEADNKHGEITALQERVQALEAQLAAKEAEQKAAAEALAKNDLLTAAGLDAKYARFLSGDQNTWQEQVNDLAALRGAAPARRDPALDADMGADSEGLENTILNMFGMGN